MLASYQNLGTQRLIQLYFKNENKPTQNEVMVYLDNNRVLFSSYDLGMVVYILEQPFNLQITNKKLIQSCITHLMLELQCQPCPYSCWDMHKKRLTQIKYELKLLQQQQ